MEWAEKEDWFIALAREGDIPKALLNRPTLRKDLQFFWSAFWALSGDRPLGFGGAGAIPFMALDAYARRFGVASRDEFARFSALLGAMDRAFLKWSGERAKEDAGNG